MEKLKVAGALALAVCSIALAGFSLYRTFLAKPKDDLAPEERARIMKAMDAFNNRGRAPRAAR